MKDIYKLIIALLIVTNSKYAYAYLDPGTGSILFQALIGGAVAAMFTIKMYWYQLKSFIKRKLGKEDLQKNAEPNSNEDDLI
ncbi:MAG: hypothetical protein O6928_10445 [Gammaproteobacteria bacterium]|nr:hypothetical protein [Gammaproteobacteria bacterium]